MINISELNPEQQEAVNYLEGPLLIIAGAGSGKTKCLTYRYANLMDHGINPLNILLLTFTNKAANEMTERAKLLIEKEDSNMKGMTYHSFCAELLRHYAEYVDFKPNFTICDDSDMVEIINLVKEKKGYTTEDNIPNSKELCSMFSLMINKEKSLDWIIDNKYPKYFGYNSQILDIKEGYNEYKMSKNIFDYDDLLLKVIDLFTDNPGICKKISDQYKYIMVDEYQDSNLLQMKLLKLLRQFENKNICVVGDPNQSIYSWRGSIMENILNFPDDFPGCKIVKLNKNYRSNQEILDLSNAVMCDIDEKFKNDLVGTYSAGYLPNYVTVNSTQDEAHFVLNKIRRFHKEGTPYNKMGVLIRRSFDSNFLESLITEGESFEYEKYGGIKFLEKASIKNIFAYLKVSINYEDEISWFRLLKLYPSIGSVNAKKISEDILKDDVSVLASQKYKKKKYGEYLDEIYEFLLSLDSLSVSEQIDKLINEYYYKVMKRSINESKMKPAMKRQKEYELDNDIEQAQILIQIAEKYKSVASFLNDLTLDASQPEIEGDKLIISTVHSAKGLEFDKVFILDCVDKVFPTDKEIYVYTDDAIEEHEKEIEEEKRLLYVAITRAKEDLFIMHPKYNFYTHEENPTSRFLDDEEILSKCNKINNTYY